MNLNRLSNWKATAYSLPVLPMSMLHAPALVVLPALYAKHTSIGLATIGMILILVRVLDVVTDPIIGFLSDRTNTRVGRRKPWIIIGIIITLPSTYFWMQPHAEAGVLWFFCSYFLVSLGWTLIEVPHTAWLHDISNSYHERTRLSAYRLGAFYLGYLLFMSIPLWPVFSTTEMTPEVTATAAWMVILFAPIVIIISVLVVPENVGHKPPPNTANVSSVFNSFFNNKPFQIISTVYLLNQVASGMVGAMYYFFIDAYLGILEKFAHVGIMAAVIGFGSTLIWPTLINKFDKHKTLSICLSSTALTLFAMSFIRPDPAAFYMLATVFSISALFVAGTQICLISIITDVIDYDEFITGSNKAGNIFAFSALFQKLGLACGGGVAFIIVSYFGFDPESANSSFAMTGFFLTFLALPIVLNLVAVPLAWNFPINRSRHQLIQTRLQRRRGNSHTNKIIQ